MERFAIKIDKNLRANLYKICRLCGIDNPDKIKVRDDTNIVNLEDGEPELWKKVFDCIGLMITKDDKMPQFMCTLCVDKINDFFEFREMCYATDAQTRKLLGIKKEPKAKAAPPATPSSIDFKTEDIKEPIPEPPPQRGRKRRNADMEVCRDIKTDESEDIKPSTTANVVATSNASKKKRIKLSSNIPEPDTKIEPGAKPKKEPLSNMTPKLGRPTKIPLSKKRLKTEPPTIKENKKAAKLTKLMNKKLKLEASTAAAVPVELLSKKKKELVRLRKLPQAIVKAERLKKSLLVDTKIKEETSVAPENPNPVATTSTKTNKQSKSKDKCTICNESFVNKSHLDKHVKTTHIPSVSRYHCVQCNETLKKNMEIKNHNLWHKLSKTPFQCGKCSEASCSIYTYTKHIRDCNSVAYLDSHIPDWHCPDCSGNYETTYLFNIHLCVSKGLVCPGCEKSFKWKDDYHKHTPTCPAAFSRIPPYMTSNIQVKNEAELPTSPIPPHTTQSLQTTASNVLVQSTPSSRIAPPQLDSTQCVVIPGNISFHEEAAAAGSSSPSKTSRKGKRITKKDLKRFDKLLKSTMTTLVSIKHEPSQDEVAADSGNQSSSTEVKEQTGERTSTSPTTPESHPGSPMAFDGGDDDFHHNGDDSDSADDDEQQAPPTKLVGKIKQEIIDEGYRDLYNNIEVNIKHEIEVNKNPVPVDCAPKPILKLKITKEHGTLNSILVDSPISEKKKKKKKRKEDRTSRLSPEKEAGLDVVQENATTEVEVESNRLPTVENLPSECIKTVDSVSEQLPTMPLPEVIEIKKEIPDPELPAAVVVEEAPSQNTPSIVAASSGSLQIACVNEGVTFHETEENEPETPQHDEYSAPEESVTNWADPIPSMELSLNAVSLANLASDLSMCPEPVAEKEEDEEIDIKPRLEDLIPMLQIASVTSAAEVVEKPPVKTPVKRKRRPTVAKTHQMPKIVSISSGTEVVSHESDIPLPDETVSGETRNEDVFDFSQVKIKEEIFDPGYDKENPETPQQAVEDEDPNDDDNEEVEEGETFAAFASEKQAEENAYIANIDFNNLNIKQEKEYIDDGLENSVGFVENPEEDEDDLESDNESEDSSSSDDEDESVNNDSESEREYRDLPSEEDEDQSQGDENVTLVTKTTKTLENFEEPKEQVPSLGLQILEVHSGFSSPNNKKTETSEESHSDQKECSHSMDERKSAELNEINDNQSIPMEVDGQNETNHEVGDIKMPEQFSVAIEQSDNDPNGSRNESIALVNSLDEDCTIKDVANSESLVTDGAIGNNIPVEERVMMDQTQSSSQENVPTNATLTHESNEQELPVQEGYENAVQSSSNSSVVGVQLSTLTFETNSVLEQPTSDLTETSELSRVEALTGIDRTAPVDPPLENNHNCQLPTQELSSTPVQSSSPLQDTALSFSQDISIRIDNIRQLDASENVSQNTDTLMELSSSIPNTDPSSSHHDTQDMNTIPQLPTAAAEFNIPPFPMDNLQHNFDALPSSSHASSTTIPATLNCNNQPSRFSDFQDLNLPTAGQLQTSFVHHPNESHASASSSTNNCLTNLSSLSEEVQNLLNEETVAVNNFEYNDCVLRARDSIVQMPNLVPAPVAVPNPVFNDFENLNEIAENNNNANIERELQDELGNVLADAIADRSNNDEVDENNVMNENRANFDIT